jgi:tetrahydromethanopterin S-methyltransferase subunit E
MKLIGGRRTGTSQWWELAMLRYRMRVPFPPPRPGTQLAAVFCVQAGALTAASSHVAYGYRGERSIEGKGAKAEVVGRGVGVQRCSGAAVQQWGRRRR